jgi:hypothetical protein
MPVAINEAKLMLPVADTNLTQQKGEYFPSKLILYLIKPEGGYSFVYDYVINDASFGGDYDEVTTTYNFTLKVQLQSLARGDVDNLEMIIRPSLGNQSVSGVVLNGWSEDFMKRIKLEITYTKL